MTKVFKSQFGRKYIIPAEYNVFIDFAPISYKESGQDKLAEGKFQFLAKWIASVSDEQEADDTIEKVRRLEPIASGDSETQPTDNNENDKQYEQ